MEFGELLGVYFPLNVSRGTWEQRTLEGSTEGNHQPQDLVNCQLLPEPNPQPKLSLLRSSWQQPPSGSLPALLALFLSCVQLCPVSSPHLPSLLDSLEQIDRSQSHTWRSHHSPLEQSFPLGLPATGMVCEFPPGFCTRTYTRRQ